MHLPTLTEPSFTAGSGAEPWQMAQYHMALGNSGDTQASREVFSAAFSQL